MSFLRTAKYYTKGYSDVQSKLRDATSNAEQPPTGRMMNELSQLSFNQENFLEMVEILDKRLNDKGKNWKHVYKSLLVLDYLLHSGSESVVLYFRKNSYLIKTLTEFQYVDEEGKDQGLSVRSRAKDIANLLADETRLRQNRKNRAEMRDRMLGRPTRSSKENDEDYENENVQRRNAAAVDAAASTNEDPELARRSALLAIRAVSDLEDRHLKNAFQFSHAAEARKQEEQKAKELAQSFDDIFATQPPAPAPPVAPVQQPQQPPPMASSSANPQTNNPFPLIVLDDVDTTTVQPSFGLQGGMQASPVSFNPFQQQAQLEMMQQAEQLRLQQEWMQAQAAQQAQMQAQMQAQAQAQLAQQAFFQPQVQNDPWLHAQQQVSQSPLPSPSLGSKNPFLAASTSVPSLYASSSSFSSSSTSLASQPLSPAPSTSLFAPPSPSPSSAFFSPPSPAPSSKSASQTRSANKFKVDTDHLENLFAARDDSGMDTFGNIGNLRFGPNQHQHLMA